MDDKTDDIAPEELERAGPDTLRRILVAEQQRRKKLEELLAFARLAAKSAAGNLLAIDERCKVFDEIVAQYRVK